MKFEKENSKLNKKNNASNKLFSNIRYLTINKTFKFNVRNIRCLWNQRRLHSLS